MSHMRPMEMRKWERRERRAGHVRSTVFGTAQRPRLSVYRSHRHFHAQLIDDSAGRTLASASSLQKDLKTSLKHGGDKKAAEAVGKKLAEVAKAAGVGAVVFDRNFFRFHGRVRAFAEAAAKGGLSFLLNPKKKGKAPKAPKAEAKAPEKVKKEKQVRPPGAPGKEGGGKGHEKKKE